MGVAFIINGATCQHGVPWIRIPIKEGEHGVYLGLESMKHERVCTMYMRSMEYNDRY